MQPGLLGAISPEEQRGLLEPYEQRLRLEDIRRAPGAVADAFGQAGRAGLEGYATALSGVDADGRTVAGILPMAMDERTGERSLASPRILDLWNTVGGVVPGGGAVLGAGPVVRRGAKALDMSQEARMARASDQGYGPALYHGTRNDFREFDVGRTNDIGIHLGTPDQASTAARNAWTGGFDDGAQVMPVVTKASNPLRVKDQFSTLGQRFIARAKALTLETPGFRVSPEERVAIYDAAKRADAARKRGGGDWKIALDKNNAKHREAYESASKEFWETVDASLKRQGYDSLVYSNRVEGKGDSYVVLNPKNIRSTQAAFDPARADSADLLASRAAPGGLLAAPERERMTYRDIEGLL